MAIEPVSAVVPQTQVEQIKAEQQAQVSEGQAFENGQGQVEQNGSGSGLEGQMNGMSLGQNEVELHAACAEGRLDDVRAVLSRGLEALESLDMNTGCTPIVLAIRGGHHDVVQELLAAGAIIPPPGLTTEPHMLSILYPQPMYGMPPQFMGMPPQEFYPQPPFYPGQGGEGQQRGMFVPPPPGPSGPRRESAAEGNPNNLPPAEVSKTIPCRNFPNCKYGASCVFFHPQQQFFRPGPSGPNGFVPQGYEGGFAAPYPPAPGPYFVPANGQPFNPAFNPEQTQAAAPTEMTQEQQQQSQADATNQQSQTQNGSVPSQHIPSAVAPVFVPGFQPNPAELMGSPPPSGQFGLSPMSPSMLGSSLPPVPPAETFFAATSPANGFMSPPPPAAMNVAPHARRQSFNQQQYGVPGKPYHGKKPSFSGGPKPWLGRTPAPGGAAKLGSWKDGNPPPCAFFSQGNCRNGEYCKFPHLDTEGNDCRHPDVVRGVVPPLPSLSRQSRGMRMMGPGFAPFDPSFRQHQHHQQMQFLQHQRMAAAQAQQGAAPAAAATEGEASVEAPASGEDAPTDAENSDDSAAAPIAEDAASEAPATAPAQSTTPATAALPAKPVAAAAASLPVGRSASQPGVQRVHANGPSSRSHSPAPSNVSFHGNGHPRRAGSRVPQMNGNGMVNAGSRPASGAGEKRTPSVPAQRVPLAHEFPALGTPNSEKKEPQWSTGKTAAQVLSAPAPPKPEVKVTPTEGASESDKSDKASVTMDSDSESDAVIISTKPSSAAVSGNASPAVSAAEPKRAPISFASALGAATGASLEAAPVALKA
ncbi:hypothetical protein IAU60_003337 [Kwoniella sp. DSM 27419]